MKLQSLRLDLAPLTAAELSLAVNDYEELQRQLGLKAISTPLDEEMLYAMRVRHSKVLQDQENYLWLTNWAIIQQEDQCIIGFIILKGRPNELGEVIVGYVVDEEYRRKGYATEALQTLISWIFSHPGAQSVIADTEKDNVASHQVLKHLGAQQYRETEDLFWWRIAKKKRHP